jgi:hypothetical protein
MSDDFKKFVPAPEVRAALKSFIAKQREHYGDDWKEKLSAEMAEKAMPFMRALQQLARRQLPPCEHDFGGWREHADGHGGEQFCRKCGMGAMEHTLRNDPT